MTVPGLSKENGSNSPGSFLVVARERVQRLRLLLQSVLQLMVAASGVLDVVEAVLWSDVFHELAAEVPKALLSSLPSAADQPFEFRKGLFNRIQIG